MKQCNLPTTAECFARPCNNCIPSDKSREEMEFAEAKLNRPIDEESGYWYMYDETDPNEAWQEGGNADIADEYQLEERVQAEAAEIADWLEVGEFPTSDMGSRFIISGGEVLELSD